MAGSEGSSSSGSCSVTGWAARDSTGVLSPYVYELRATGPEDVRIKVLYCGICHTDIHQLKNHLGNSKYLMVPGHEVVGEVVEVGATAAEKFAAGEVVGVGTIVGSCGECGACTESAEQYCIKNIKSYNDFYPGDGKPTMGGFATARVAHHKFVVKIPAGILPEQAAPLLCAGVTVYSPLKHFGLTSLGLRGGVVGLGGVGHVGVLLAKAMGHHVTVISSSGERKKAEAVGGLGADAFVASSDDSQMAAAAGSLDYVLDTVPVAHSLEPYVSLLRHRGKLVLMWAVARPLELPAVALLFGGKSVVGTFVGSMAEQAEVMGIVATAGIRSAVEVIRMDYLNEALERLERNDVRYRFVVDVAGSNLDPLEN